MNSFALISQSGRGLPHSMTLAREPVVSGLPQVLECGGPPPLFLRVAL
jgi:hypothetical protein